MKLRDYMEAQRLFYKEPRVKKEEITFKKYMKFKKDLEDFEKLNKKDEKKEDKKGWAKLSVIQQTAILFVAGHVLTLTYVALIFKVANAIKGG